ncbi:uncharacterized protein V6R79_000362 [Siganus canaliculatus]
MEALYVQPWEEDGVLMKKEGQERSREQEEKGVEVSFPTGSTTDEETDEDSEPEPPPVTRRKVSFADAFGLNLVSVKEFDNAEEAEAEIIVPSERETTSPLEEFYMSCLFTVPSSSEELDQRLQAQMVELENIELLPGTTTIRGTVRVMNLCYSKSVYARMSFDHWASSFDLLAEYVPGSSDRKTDRFSFKYTLVPPFEKDGTRLEFCLRYETSVGSFWANNNEMNYVLFCHQRVQVNEPGLQVQEESAGHRSKRSCLKANRRRSADLQIWGNSDLSGFTPGFAPGAADKTAEADRTITDSAKIHSLLYHKEHKPLVDSIKSRHRATRLARVQDYFSQRRQHVPTKTVSHDSANSQKVPQPLPAAWGDSTGFLHKLPKQQPDQSPQVLTYHQIPLLTLDWNNDGAHVDDIWSGETKTKWSKESADKTEAASSSDKVWETFCNGTNNRADGDVSASDAWQMFLSGPDRSDVPESEWLQTATSVSPSNDKKPSTQLATNSQGHECPVWTDTALCACTPAACQPLSDTRKTSLVNMSLNAAQQQPAEACVSSPRDDNTATQNTSQRSERNSETDTRQESLLKGAAPVSEVSVDSSAECHKNAAREREREEIIGLEDGIIEDEPFPPHTADLLTSSRETETTDRIGTPKSPNASSVDNISQGARLDEGLSSSREGQVTGAAHKDTNDSLAFRETIGRGTKDEERVGFSITRRQAVEEGKSTENEVPTGREIFRPEKTEECEIFQSHADEKQHEELRRNQDSENPLQENESDGDEIRGAQSHADELNSNPSRQNSKLDESENENVASNNKDSEEFEKAEKDPSHCATRKESTKLIGAEAGIIQVLNEKARQHNDKAVQQNSSGQRGKASMISETHKQPKTIQAQEELTETQVNVGLEAKAGEDVSEKGKSSTYDGIIVEERNPRAQTNQTVESQEMKGVIQSDDNTSRPLTTHKCIPNPLEVMEMTRTHSQVDTNGQISSEEVMAKESLDAKGSLPDSQHQLETIERNEKDTSQRDRDERVSIEKLETEARQELMCNVGIPQGQRKNAAAQLKGGELSAEVESSHRVECGKLSDGTKDPITAENIVPLEAMELGLEEMFIERFGDDLVRRIWEEAFDLKVQGSNRDVNDVGMVGDLSDINPDHHLPYEKSPSDDAFDSGVFSLTEFPSDPDPSLHQCREQTTEAKDNEYFPKEIGQTLVAAEQDNFISNSNLSAYLSDNVSPVSVAHCLNESIESSPDDQDMRIQIKDRSVTHRDIGRQTEERMVSHKESFNQSDYLAHRDLSATSETFREPHRLVWWSVLYILSHILRLLVCILLVAAFFFITFLWDFPSFLTLYMASLCWWFYKGKNQGVIPDKGMEG